MKYPVKNERLFNGEIYHLRGIYNLKKSAKEGAGHYRRDKQKARVVPYKTKTGSTHYAVYTCHKWKKGERR